MSLLPKRPNTEPFFWEKTEPGPDPVSPQLPIPKEYYQKKHDSGKVRMDLLPLDALKEIAKVYTFGCTPKEKGGAGYEENSWKSVPDGYKRYKAAALRHLADAEKEDLDPESQLYHLAHHAWNAIALLWFKLHGRAPEVEP